MLFANGIASLSELKRSTGISRNWLNGLMMALEALGVVEYREQRLSRSTCLRLR